MSSANTYALEQPLVARLQELTADVPQLRAGSAITLVGTTNISRLLPGAFVRPLGVTAVEPVGYGIRETQRWEVVAAVQAIADKQDLSRTYTALGKLLQRIIVQLHGWTAPDVGTLEYTGRDEPVEIPGHVECALQFSVDILVDLSDTTSMDDFLTFYPVYDLADTDADEDARDEIRLPGQPAFAADDAMHDTFDHIEDIDEPYDNPPGGGTP